MQPWMGGGEMIQDVFLDHSTYADPPSRFVRGDPSFAIGCERGAALIIGNLGGIHEHSCISFGQSQCVAPARRRPKSPFCLCVRGASVHS